jgi:membrane protein
MVSTMATGRTSVCGIDSSVRNFFLRDIWALRLEGLPRWKAASIRFLRVLTTAVSEFFAGRVEIIGMLGPLVLHVVRLTPFILVWALFTLIYTSMPNIRVPFGATVAGLLYQLVQWIYIDLQVGMAKQNAIYGSFAALPLFLAWIQISWTIVLFGAELCCAVQHSDGYCSATDCPTPTLAEKRRSLKT